ncbi:T9SS type A sorting domain-containing protein [Aquimarina algiphila]|uniref:T9SS type A sorting domain-containing protein n=1 Tax=Aquimarina algiphila TaxID=2047982 RepID=UPI00232CA1F0|nr:T9SS type A sorting domain-containing protein [Aquimarina algiphila]
MIKQLPFVFVSLLFTIISNAQTGNQTLGSAITPNQSNASNTPFPYDGTETFTPGASLTTGDWNLSIGPGAGSALTESYSNILIGGMAGALLNESTSFRDANDNVVIGNFAADQTIYVEDNVFIGNYVARNATNSDNVIIGHRAGSNLTSGRDNTIVGEEAGRNLIDGEDNVLIGEDAGYELTTGDDNCFVGSRAGAKTTTASGNTFVGGEVKSFTPSTLGNGVDYDFSTIGGAVGASNTTGEANTFIGSGAGLDNVDGFANTFLGYAAGANSQHADGNTFIGYGTGWDNNRTNNRNDANRNTYMGVLTGGTNREGSDNIGIGWKADFAGNGVNGPSDNKNNRNIFLGNSVSVFGDDQVIIGHAARSSGNRGSITIGALSSTGGSYAAAIGYDVDVTQANTMALGGSTATNRMSVGIGTIAANQNASLELADIDKGFLVNRVTTAQRTTMETAAASGNPLATTEAGMIVYDTDLSSLFVWDGTQWVNSTIDTNTDTDDQTIDEFQLNGDDLELSLLDDAEATKTVDLSKYLDNTDSQELSLATNTLSISGGTTTVDLAGYLDNTDSQELSLGTNTLSISGGTATIDLSGYLDNTDTQDLTSANLNGTNLTIAIENGASVSVDLSPVLSSLTTDLGDAQSEIIDLQTENTAQQVLIDDLITRIEALESDVVGQLNKSKTPILYQNIPNPFNGTSSIKYYLPTGINNATVVFSNSVGQVISTVAIKQSGDGELNINSDGLAAGTYFYTLYIGSRKIDTKKMVIE